MKFHPYHRSIQSLGPRTKCQESFTEGGIPRSIDDFEIGTSYVTEGNSSKTLIFSYIYNFKYGVTDVDSVD